MPTERLRVCYEVEVETTDSMSLSDVYIAAMEAVEREPFDASTVQIIERPFDEPDEEQ